MGKSKLGMCKSKLGMDRSQLGMGKSKLSMDKSKLGMGKSKLCMGYGTQKGPFSNTYTHFLFVIILLLNSNISPKELFRLKLKVLF